MSIAIEESSSVTGDYVTLDGEGYFRIENCHLMPDFFMSLVGASDHWMFISSFGALTAGRRDPDSALFPYASDDQVSLAQSSTGSFTLIRDRATGQLWEPLTPFAATEHSIRRNLYKNPLGTKLVFEEIHEELELVFRYRWVFSEAFGFVRDCWLENRGERSRELDLIDGLRNILPYGVTSEFMARYSNLANAYKKSELLPAANLGLYYLSSIPTDRAEPSEGLKTTTVWQRGLTPSAILLSCDQIPAFRQSGQVTHETDVRGKAGAYLVHQQLSLASKGAIHWRVVAELEQDHTDVANLTAWLEEHDSHSLELDEDIQACEFQFREIISSADGIQVSHNLRRTNRHLSNTVFNVMRGGVPMDGYEVRIDDFLAHLGNFNTDAATLARSHLDPSDTMKTVELQAQVAKLGDSNLDRLAMEYLPLAFSRRHGDPTRPWNRFSIQLRAAGGKTSLNYQGNWRDLFQNWEALAVSFPQFTTGMISRFVNATTADGYNPYRVTKNGFEWEEPSPEDPWANIGYWGDHQIIYLLKLLEWENRINPAGLNALLGQAVFVHANVPYRIKDFDAIKRDPQSTIDFDHKLSQTIAARVQRLGADGKLLQNSRGEIQPANLLEKMLTLSLAKLSNFVPDGGIWLNTQRPEWNDANNALVGNGLSMVTTYYLYRWFRFFESMLQRTESECWQVSSEVADFFAAIHEILIGNPPAAKSALTPTERGAMVSALSIAGSSYRNKLYEEGMSGETAELSLQDCLHFCTIALQHLETTIRNNRRTDGLYHSYNLLRIVGEEFHVEALYEMLEGQVAVLSSGLLTGTEAVEVLDALRASALYRENQNSYMLYPDRALPRFVEKNQVPESTVASSPLLQLLLEQDENSIVSRDRNNAVHFNGSFRNSADLRAALDGLPQKYHELVSNEREHLLQEFSNLFNHHAFTGRSGTFFAYEGLGSIYWHMVSKLGLAVAENFFLAVAGSEAPNAIAALKQHFQNVRAGVGAEKSPEEYGAFPTDAYSHTPENAGVKQPGMTGQVKEDLLSRFAELGMHLQDGQLQFRFDLLDRSELLAEPTEMHFVGLDGSMRKTAIPEGAYGFTICQVPVVCVAGTKDLVTIRGTSGSESTTEGLKLSHEDSQALFSRSGNIQCILVQFSLTSNEENKA